MVNKIFGVLSFIFGVWIIVLLPPIEKYTPKVFSNAIILIGIFFVALGIYILQA